MCQSILVSLRESLCRHTRHGCLVFTLTTRFAAALIVYCSETVHTVNPPARWKSASDIHKVNSPANECRNLIFRNASQPEVRPKGNKSERIRLANIYHGYCMAANRSAVDTCQQYTSWKFVKLFVWEVPYKMANITCRRQTGPRMRSVEWCNFQWPWSRVGLTRNYPIFYILRLFPISELANRRSSVLVSGLTELITITR